MILEVDVIGWLESKKYGLPYRNRTVASAS
jgi:hypothetical protein